MEFVKASLQGRRRNIVSSKMPFTHQACFVPSILHHFANRVGVIF